MLLTNYGGASVVGLTNSNNGDVSGNHGSTDCWVVKLDTIGAIQWQRALGGNLGEAGYEVIENSDGSFVVSGHAASNTGDVFGNHGQIDGWVMKLDANGVLLWQNALGGSDWDVSHALLSTADGGYLIAGGSASSDGDVTGEHGLHDAWLVQLDAAGDLIWQVPFGGSSNEGAQTIALASDGGYVFAANSGSTDGVVLGNQGIFDFWIVKLTDSAAAIPESALKPLSIAPNPATGHCTVSIVDAVHTDALLLRDPQGSTVLRVPTFGREPIHVPLAVLVPGAYVMSTIGEDRTTHTRLVVTY